MDKVKMVLMEWHKSPKIGVGIILLICFILYWFIMIPAESSPYEYMNKVPVSHMAAGSHLVKETARQEFAQSESVFGNTMEEVTVNKYYPPVPIPSEMQFKLRNVTPHMASI